MTIIYFDEYNEMTDEQWLLLEAYVKKQEIDLNKAKLIEDCK